MPGAELVPLSDVEQRELDALEDVVQQGIQVQAALDVVRRALRDPAQ